MAQVEDLERAERGERPEIVEAGLSQIQPPQAREP
jgi:hypothetical protein